MRGCLEICFHGPGNGVSTLHPSSAIKFACKSDPLANARATRQTKSAFWKKRRWPFFPYTAYTISYNGRYSSFLDLSHGIKSCHKGLRKTGRGQGGYRGIPPGRGPAPLTNPSDNLIMTTALEGKRPAAAVKNPIGRCRKNPRPALAEVVFSARCAGKEPVGKDIEGERKMLPHVSALSRWADEGPHF